MIIIQDWQAAIAEMYLEKQKLSNVDPKGIFPFFLPNEAATEESVAYTENELSVPFDQEHRTFLQFANGWQCFYQNVTLFGTTDFIEGSLHDAAFEALEYMPELLESLEFKVEELLPIAASMEQADVFVMAIKNGHIDPKVYWLAEGELIDSYETFGEYFMSMIDYTKRRTEKLQ